MVQLLLDGSRRILSHPVCFIFAEVKHQPITPAPPSRAVKPCEGMMEDIMCTYNEHYSL